MKKIIVLANTKAGQKQRFQKALKILKANLSKVKADYRIYHQVEDIPREEFNEEVDRFIVMGGDGTLSFVSQFLYPFKNNPPIGVIPVGSGNIFAQALGIPLNIRKAVKCTLFGRPQDVPCGLVNNEKAFIIGIGTGVHASLMEKTPRWSKKMLGAVAYYLRLPLHLTKIKRHSYRLTFPDKSPIETSASAIYILNGLPKISKEPFKNMDAFKPVLYVLILEQGTAREVVKLFSSVFLLGKMPKKGAHFLETTAVTLETEEAPLNLDGEKIIDKKLTLTVASKKFHFLLPK